MEDHLDGRRLACCDPIGSIVERSALAAAAGHRTVVMQAEPLDEMAGVAAVPARLAPGEPLRELRHLVIISGRVELSCQLM